MDFDYNLLKVLGVLLDTQSTTLAAEKLYTSQPAVSRSLNKLRSVFNDDLLVRRGAQMELTPKAQTLQAQLPEVIAAIDSLVEKPAVFEPLGETRDLRIAMNASLAQWFAAPFASRLASVAPKINLTIEDWTDTTPDKIAGGEVDYGINYFPMDLAKHLVQRKGGQDDFVLACRAGHPLVGKSVGVSNVERYPYAVHLIKHWNDREEHISKLLKPLALKPRVQLRTAHLNIILAAMQSSDLLLPCSRYLAQQLGDKYGYVEIDATIPKLNANFGYVYGVKWRNDPFIVWLSGEVQSQMSAIENAKS